jgi:Uma2 family endonuclease
MVHLPEKMTKLRAENVACSVMQTLEATKPRPRRRTPESLVYKRWGGRTYYRRGYREVLKGLKTEDDVRGSNGLQAFIVSHVLRAVYRMSRPDYRVLTGKPSWQPNRSQFITSDLLIYEKSVLTPDKITTRSVDVPPKISIEVDVKIELEKLLEVDYLFDKAQTYLRFGVETVFWVLSSVRKVFIFRNGQEAVIQSWSSDLELLDGVVVNIGRYLDAEGVKIPPKA